MITLKKMLIKCLAHFRIDTLLAPSEEIHPTEEGWSPDYVSVPNLENYSMVYVRVHVYGVYAVIPCPNTGDAYSQTITDAYNSGGTWTYGRMLLEVDFDNNQIGLSTVNGSMSEMGITHVWGTGKL